MKRISSKVLTSCLIGEILALFCTIILIKNNNYTWLIVAFFSIMIVLTFYECISRLNSIITLWSENNKVKEQENKEEMKLFRTRIMKDIEQKAEVMQDFSSKIVEYLNKLEYANNELHDSIQSTTALQAKTSNENKEVVEKILNIMDRMEVENKKTINDLSIRFTEHSQAMSARHSEDLNSVANELNKIIDLLTREYVQALEDMSDRQKTQIEEWKAGTAEILSNSNASITILMNNVEEKLLENSNLAKKVLDENIVVTRNAVSEIVTDARELLQKQYVRLEELNSSLSLETKEYSQQLMEQILGVSSNNIEKMEASCEKVLSITLDRIIAENEESEVKRTEAFKTYIKELEKAYNDAISKHIELLKQEISEKITLFISENKSALMTNNKLAAGLIDSENSFVSEIKDNNVKLRETIDDALGKYSNIAEQNINDIKNTLAEHIRRGYKDAVESIKLMSENNSETVDNLAEKLKIYSDSLVEKSAIAIANVQSDNNENLQELSKKVSGYISDNAKFMASCKEAGEDLHRSIGQMIDDRNKFIVDLNVISSSHLKESDSYMQSRIEDMVNKLQTLNIKNVELFSSSMDKYREKFVEASANAIAQVQVDNVNAITDANDKVSKLATNLKKFEEDISGVLSMLLSTIEDGLRKQKEQGEDFDAAMNNLMDDKLTEYNKKLQIYNEGIEVLGKQITDVINACHSNTVKYDETLRYIIEAQKEANSLNSKDVELLETFIKR